jgi:hypothetical protein
VALLEKPENFNAIAGMAKFILRCKITVNIHLAFMQSSCFLNQMMGMGWRAGCRSSIYFILVFSPTCFSEFGRETQIKPSEKNIFTGNNNPAVKLQK